MLSTRPSNASKNGALRTVPNPAIATTSMSAAVSAVTTSRENLFRSKSGPKSVRSTTRQGMPLAFATSMTPHARSTSTAATSIFASIIAWYMDPVPDASTANRTLGKLVARGYRDAMISAMSSPASVGLSPTFAPASRKASILASAVPLPPETIAPACPIFFPGGAVTPAM